MSVTPRALIVYESMFGNSQKVATAIRDGLSGLIETDLVRVDGAPDAIPPEVRLLLVGGPTHAFSMSRAGTRQEAAAQGQVVMPPDTGIREWLDKLGERTTSTAVATFDTRVTRVRHLPGSAARSAFKALRRKGFRTIAGPNSFFVADVTGPIDEAELVRAKQWGVQLGEKLNAELDRDRNDPRPK